MCGIIVIASRSRGVQPEDLENALRSLAHRGPDELGRWRSPDGRTALGHARLSIIDAETGSQPMPNETGDLRLVVNGEFYDFERIRRELEERGHRFSSRSDSEIALHLYEEYGERCLERLRGEFAFAIWDETNKRLFAARDRFGIKPLFYARVDSGLILASEAKALFAAGVAAGWDSESVFQNLYFSFDQDRSLFKRVRQVPPGHYLTFEGDTLRVRRYWDIDYPRAKDQDSSIREAELVEKTRSLIDEAVRLRMRADVPVGCYLSGGVDSSSVLGLMARHSDTRPKAFSIAFEGEGYDESASAERTAHFAGADFHPVRVTAKEFAGVFTEAVGHGEMVHYNAHGAARYLLSRAVRGEGYKVVLAGEGADELFAGYDFSSRAVLEAGDSLKTAALFRLLFRLARPNTGKERRIAEASPFLARLSRVLSFPEHLVEYITEKFDLVEDVMDADFRSKFRHRDAYREFFRQIDYRGALFRREPAKQILYLWMKSVFVNYVLAAERLDMAHAVEVRLPFLDHKLVEFGRSIPVATLAKNGRLKHLLREAVRPNVTPEVYNGLKQPFLAPPTALKHGDPMHDLLQDILRGNGFAAIPFFDRKQVMDLLDRMPGMDAETRASLDPVLFVMASFAIIGERYRL